MRPYRTIPVVAALFGAGCYTYQPAPPAPTPPGTSVRAELVAQGAPPSAAMIGASAMRVEGVVRAADDSTLTLAVAEVVRRSGVPERWSGENVLFARREVTQLTVRSFSRTNTTIAAALAVLGAYLAARAFSGGGEGATAVIAPPGPGR